MEKPSGQPFPQSSRESFWLPWGVVILGVALGCRLLWVLVFQGEVGGDAIRYLWISEHVRQGNWLLVPQLFSSPLLPLAIGLLTHLTGEALLAARLIGIVGNTLAVGLAMLWIRALTPERPALAWLTGLGLAVNHVWCRLAPFALTENFFYPLLMGLFLLAAQAPGTPALVLGVGLRQRLGSAVFEPGDRAIQRRRSFWLAPGEPVPAISPTPRGIPGLPATDGCRLATNLADRRPLGLLVLPGLRYHLSWGRAAILCRIYRQVRPKK